MHMYCPAHLERDYFKNGTKSETFSANWKKEESCKLVLCDCGHREGKRCIRGDSWKEEQFGEFRDHYKRTLVLSTTTMITTRSTKATAAASERSSRHLSSAWMQLFSFMNLEKRKKQQRGYIAKDSLSSLYQRRPCPVRSYISLFRSIYLLALSRPKKIKRPQRRKRDENHLTC